MVEDSWNQSQKQVPQAGKCASFILLCWLSANSLFTLYWLSTDSILTRYWLYTNSILTSTSFYWLSTDHRRNTNVQSLCQNSKIISLYEHSLCIFADGASTLTPIGPATVERAANQPWLVSSIQVWDASSSHSFVCKKSADHEKGSMGRVIEGNW